MEELTWGIPLFFDLWLAGMVGGAFFSAFLVHLFGADEDKRLLGVATYVGLPLVLLGALALMIDLGEPLRFWHLYLGLRPSSWHVVPLEGVVTERAGPLSLSFHPTSAMSLGSWILVLWSANAVALIVLWIAGKAGSREWVAPATKVFGWIGFVLSALLMTYTGVVLGASSQTLWQATLLLPSLFVASATTTGVAALVIVAPLMGIGGRKAVMAQLRKALAVLIAIQIGVLVSLLTWLSATRMVGALASGTLGLFFWIGVVLLGLLIPLGLELSPLGEKLRPAAAVLVLVGGLLLRAVVVIGGQV